MKRFLLILLLAGFLVSTQAETTLHLERFNRPDSLVRSEEVLLNGAWQYRVSLKDDWHSIQVPHMLRSQGLYTLRRYFDLDSTHHSDSYRLVFENIEGISTIYLNKKLLGTRQNTFTPIVLNVAKQDLFFNEHNELVVDLDTRVNYRNSVPHWVRSRGIPALAEGLVRPVKLTYGRKPCLTAITAKTNAGVLDINVTIQKSVLDSLILLDKKMQQGQSLKCQILVYAPNGVLPFHSVILPISEQTASEVGLQTTVSLLTPVLWAPRLAASYRIQVTLLQAEAAVDRAEMRISYSNANSWYGLRWKAIEWIEDYRIKELAEKELVQRIEQDMKAIYKTGANAVRVLGCAPPEHLLSTCDQLGLAVFIEVPVVNMPSQQLADVGLKKKAEVALMELVRLGQGHPCIAGWGLGSGYDAYDPKAISFLTDMRRVAKELDPRPVYACFRGERVLPDRLPVDLAIYETRPERIIDLALPQAGISCQLLYRLSVPMPPVTGNESYMEQIHAFQLKNVVNLVLNSDKVQGVVVSPLSDYWSDSPHLMWGDRNNTNLYTGGLFDTKNEPRSAYRVVTSIFSGTPLPELLPGEWFRPDPYVFQALGLVLLLVILFFIKQDKRMSHYVRRAFIYPHGFYTDLVENRQLSPFLTGLVGLASFLSIAAIFTSFIYFYRSNTYIDEWLTWLFPSAKLKFYAIWLIWHPAAMILFLTTILEGLAVVQALLIKISVLWQRRYLRFAQIFSFVHWVPACFLFSMPIVIVLYRSLEKSYLVSIILFVLMFLVAWFLVRMFRGLKVILQTTALRALLYQILLLAVVVIAKIIYFEPSRALLAYISYYSSLLTR